MKVSLNNVPKQDLANFKEAAEKQLQKMMADQGVNIDKATAAKMLEKAQKAAPDFFTMGDIPYGGFGGFGAFPLTPSLFYNPMTMFPFLMMSAPWVFWLSMLPK